MGRRDVDGSRWLPCHRIAEVAVSETFRRPVQLVLAAAVVLALVAAGMVATTLVRGRGASASGGVMLAGTGEIPPIDGDPTDTRDRHVVRLDPAVFDALGGSDDEQGLVAPGRATSMDGGDAESTALDGMSSGVASSAEEDLADALAASDARIDEVTAMGRGWYAVVSSGLGDAGLADLPGVVGVERDPLAIPAQVEPAPALFDHQWALENTGQTIEGLTGRDGADIGWKQVVTDTGYTGAGVTVAVIDSGIDATIDPGVHHAGTAPSESESPEPAHAASHVGHPGLPSLWINEGDDCPYGVEGADDDDGKAGSDVILVNDCAGWDFVNDDNTVYDDGADNEHGTAVAGVIAGQGDESTGVVGVAPGVELMSVKIMDGGSFPSSRAAMAIDYAVAKGADIVNASWTTVPGEGESTPLREAIADAGDRGVLIVAAAGNSGSNIDHDPVLPAAFDGDHVISVGAADAADQVSTFSNYGPEGVDLFAPGTSLMTTLPDGEYGFRSGTSVAAPVVTAIAALVLEQNGGDGAGTRDAVVDSAIPDTVYAGLAATGGRVHAARALGLVSDPADGALAMGFTSLSDNGGLVRAVVDIAAGSAGKSPCDGGPSPCVDRIDLTLGALDADTVMAVASHLVRVKSQDFDDDEATAQPPLDGVDRAEAGGQLYQTDGVGALRIDDLAQAESVQLAGGTGLDLHVEAELPTGNYVLMAQAWEGDTELVPAAVLFTVGDPDAAPGGGGGPLDDDGGSGGDGSGGGDDTTEEPTTGPTEDPTGEPVTSDPDRFDTDPRPETTEPTTTDEGTEEPGDDDQGGTAEPPTAEESETEDTMLEQPTGTPDDPTDSSTETEDDNSSTEREPICTEFPVHANVSPNCGTIHGGEVVTLEGDFNDLVGPEAPDYYVHFGDAVVPARVMHGGSLQVTAPEHLEPATVDVLVHDSEISPEEDDAVMTYEQAYTFYDPDAETGGGGGGDTGDGASGGGGDGGTTDDSDDGVTEEPVDPEPSHLPNGLTLTPLPDGHPLLQLRDSAWRTNGCGEGTAEDGQELCGDLVVRT